MASLMVGALPMTPQALNFGSRLSYSQSQISLFHSTSSLPLSTASTSVPFVYCGRGDRKTERGKRFNHSFGNARPRDKKKGRGPPRIPVPAVPPKIDKSVDDAVVKIEIDESLG
ncbi:30S ribosomal protein S31 [Populus alba x Populus x berolinensis]|nr:30S ribosomal protein S31 [Populus alba x Populus x berolinensis]